LRDVGPVLLVGSAGGVSEQFLNGTSAQCRLFSATTLKAEEVYVDVYSCGDYDGADVSWLGNLKYWVKI